MFRAKSFLKPVLAIAIAISLLIPQSVAASDVGNIDEGVEVSREEVAQSMAESQGISFEEAYQKLLDSEAQVIQKHVGMSAMRATDDYSDNLGYIRYTSSRTIATVTLQAWAYCQIWSQGSFRQLEQIVDKGSAYSGVSLGLTWSPRVTATLTTKWRLDLSCYGTISLTLPINVSATGKADAIALGLSVSGGTSVPLQISGILNITDRWDLY